MARSDATEENRRAMQIANEWGGIFAPFEAFYIQSIAYAGSRASDAFKRFDVARAVRDSDANQVSAVQEALAHSAALSRFFWPSGGGRRNAAALSRMREARAATLRQAFELTDESPLRDRRLRDSLEHFDERLDSYLLQHIGGQFLPSATIGDADMAHGATTHVFKLVDPKRSIFVCMGESYDFKGLRVSVEGVLKIATRMTATGYRLRTASNSGDI